MVARFARVVAGTVAVGLAVGGLVGGVGGRLAMRVLVITSDDSLKGRITDDEAVVNQFTLGGTLGLIIFLALGGAVLALGYVVLRRWLPTTRALRAALYGLFFLGIQGSTIFDPDGFDFTALAPTWLAVLLFVAILFGVGYLTVIGVDRALEGWPEFSNSTWYAYVPLLLLLPAFPILVPIAIAGAIAYVIQTNDRARRVWESRPLTVIGQLVFAIATANWAVPTLSNIGEILTS